MMKGISKVRIKIIKVISIKVRMKRQEAGAGAKPSSQAEIYEDSGFLKILGHGGEDEEKRERDDKKEVSTNSTSQKLYRNMFRRCLEAYLGFVQVLYCVSLRYI